MASITMTSSFLGAAAATTNVPSRRPITFRRGVVVAKAMKVSEESGEQEKSAKRRDLVFAAAAAAACSLAKVAMADEPKRGTEEAKKKYAAVCVANPTASICRN